MKKSTFILSCLIGSAVTGVAQQRMLVHQNDRVSWGIPVSAVDSVCYDAEAGTAVFFSGESRRDVSLQLLDSLSFAGESIPVHIHYAPEGVTVVNPFAAEGIAVDVTGMDVVVRSSTALEPTYLLTGTTGDGCFKIYSDKKFTLRLGGVSIANHDGPAINIQSSKKITVQLDDGTVNMLTDGTTYSKISGEDQKATFFSEGQLLFGGKGTLQVTGKNKHAICSDDYIRISDGTIEVLAAASDGVHASDYFRMEGGSLTINAAGDGIDVEGFIEMTGGDITVRIPGTDVKGLKCDSTLSISGGSVNMYVSGDQSKGYKSKQNILISGGTHYFETSGNAVVVDNDPSYCTATKSDGRTLITGGEIHIQSTGLAGKGISADGNIFISDATVSIRTSGNGSTYTTATNVKDSYSATCITGDSLIIIRSGTFDLSSTGTAGKCISSDGDLIFGGEGGRPVITASTSGAKYLVSGSGNNADYANPKAIKADGNLTVEEGVFIITTTKDGGEGLESKNILTINGGELDITTYDDAINASKAIVINGGRINCYSLGNDGIDSNGTLTITGGIVLSSGTNMPEEGFDCDQNPFTITGGVLIGTGGATSTPTSTLCTQQAVVYRTTGVANQLFHVRDAQGNDILTYKIPRTYSSMTILFSTPKIAKNTAYSIYKGGSVSGGTEFRGYTTGGTYTGGTLQTTFTPTQTITTIGTNPGPGGGR